MDSLIVSLNTCESVISAGGDSCTIGESPVVYLAFRRAAFTGVSSGSHAHAPGAYENRGETREREKKLHRYPSPLYYLRSFSPFTGRRSASAGPIFRRPHLSPGLVAGKIRRWPVTSRRRARESEINRRKLLNEIYGLSANVPRLCSRQSTTTVIYLVISDSAISFLFFFLPR